MPEIEPYQHRCTIQTGNLAGNKYSQTVTASDVEYRITCEHCDNFLATPEQIIAYIYAQLTEV